MVKDIVKDQFFLSRPSAPATEADIPVGQDLLDTLAAHRDGCVGMAANMIGVSKRIIVFDCDGTDMLMFNPEIIAKSGSYEAEEGCLSLPGTRKTERWQKITVQYQDWRLHPKRKTLTGFPAQIVQHEIDHLSGILI